MEERPHSDGSELNHLLTYDATRDEESAFIRKIGKVLPHTSHIPEDSKLQSLQICGSQRHVENEKYGILRPS